MKKYNVILCLFVILLAFALTAEESGDSMVQVFPQLKEWQKKGKPDIYTADNLYEYINGAADVFLSYDFQKLVTLTYESKPKQSITIDIYQHSDYRNGFGIYAQERPVTDDYLKIGVQGYYEKGILNFFKGKYYVKISSFDIENRTEG